METLLNYLRKDYPELLFTEGTSFYWSPQHKQVFYTYKQPHKDTWSILHETAHAILNHTSYSLDVELLQMEAEAWEVAKKLAKKYCVVINEDHIQDCLDSYRDWLHKRSICPACGIKSLQHEHTPRYGCFNCGVEWHVTPSRFCRPYRQSEQNNEPSLRTTHLLQA